MIWGGRWKRGLELGTHIHPWLIHVNVWQNQYSIVKQNKEKNKNKKVRKRSKLLIKLKLEHVERNLKFTFTIGETEPRILLVLNSDHISACPNFSTGFIARIQ